MPDVNIYTEGDTMEEAYKNAQDFLLSYLDCCQKLKQNPEQPTEFSKVVDNHKDGTVMLVSVEVVEKQSKHQIVTEQNNDILEDFNNILLDDDDDYSLPPID